MLRNCLRNALCTALLWLAATGVQAEESVSVCFNYSCAEEQAVVFSEQQVAQVQDVMRKAETSEQERVLLSLVLGQLYAWAGQQSPIAADRGGNFDDDEVPGRMDCIDHSTTTTRLLRMLDRRGALNFHRVLEPAWRGLFFPTHYSAQIEVIRPFMMQAETEYIQRFVVDSWFVANGEPAPVLPLDEWMEGGGPDV
jgi:hypothetical protein